RPMSGPVWPDLDRLFAPQVVAVVGASDRPGSQATTIWRLLRGWAERSGAALWPVNPNRESVDGVPCVRSLADVPGEVDVAALLVPDTPAAVAEAAAVDARFAVVFSAGWAETGPEGAAAQRDLVNLLDGHRTRLLGPNTNLNAFDEVRTDLDGPAIALLSQSGHQGRPLFMLQDNGVRVSHWAPTGNEADLDAADFIAWFGRHPDVGAVAAYLEAIRDGPRFRAAVAEATDTGTPVVVVKVGRSERGARAAATHTGALTGADRVVDGAFAQMGVTRVDDLDELGDVATTLARTGPPRPGGIAVYSISGGTGAHVADRLGAAGLPLATLSPATLDRLGELIPSYLDVSNPVDCGGPPAADERGARIIDALLADDDVAVLLTVVNGPIAPISDALVADLVAAAERTDKVVAVVWGSPVGTEPARREVLHGSSRVVTFGRLGNALTALDAWWRWHRFLDGRETTDRPSAATLGPPRWTPPPGRRGTVSEVEAKGLLTAYGIPTTHDALVTTSGDAARVAARAGGPVVLKACSAALPHKSDLGLVRVGVEGPREVRAAFRDILERARGAAPGQVDGVLVCEMVRGGVELALGVAQDPVFGPTVVIGAGGVDLEAAPDIAHLVVPFGEVDVRRALDGLRLRPLLDAHRGRPAADIDALVDAVCALGRAADELRDTVVEVDVNPLVVRVEGEGVVALDALVVVAGRGEQEAHPNG
ncbi:MAG TPA: acetate--CoA ligase family protein, partial [Iamia sp.]